MASGPIWTLEEGKYIALSLLTPLLCWMSSQRYALAALSLWEEPRYQWVGSFEGSRAYMTLWRRVHV
jgi:hypothetical protein